VPTQQNQEESKASEQTQNQRAPAVPKKRAFIAPKVPLFEQQLDYDEMNGVMTRHMHAVAH
jgi:hypothetical protein